MRTGCAPPRIFTTVPTFITRSSAGVDAIAHIPVGEFAVRQRSRDRADRRQFDTSQNYRFVIAEEDARFAGERQIPVSPRISRLDLRASDPEAVALVETEIILPNLRMLRKYNVPVLIGTDEG